MTDQPRVLITDCDHGRIDEERTVFAESGLEIDLRLEQLKETEQAFEVGADAGVFIVQYLKITRELMEHCKRLRGVVRYGVGVDSVDLAAATDCGVYVANVPDYCFDEVAEQAIALIYALARKVALLDRKIRAGEWDFRLAHPVRRMSGQVLGFLALGHIPQRIARKMSGTGLRLIAHDPYVPEDVARQCGVELVSLDELLSESDFISVHLPLTEATGKFVNAELLAKMKPSAFLINTSRGGVIDETALLEALRNGVIAGAGLDVRDPEPPAADDELLQLDCVVSSPHIGWHSEDSMVDLKSEVAREAVRMLKGEPPRSLVNTGVTPREL